MIMSTGCEGPIRAVGVPSPGVGGVPGAGTLYILVFFLSPKSKCKFFTGTSFLFLHSTKSTLR